MAMVLTCPEAVQMEQPDHIMHVAQDSSALLGQLGP